jgi:hypothetical protein
MSNLSLERLLFDPAAPTDGPLIGSYLLGGTSNTVITDTVAGSLDVNITNTSIAVTGTITVGADADDAAATYAPIGVGGVAYDQASALGALSAAGDRGHLLMDLYRRVFVNDAPNRAYACDNIGVSDTETDLATPLAGRTRILIHKVGANPCEIVQTGSLYGTGLVVSKGTTLALEAGQALDFKAICDTGKTTSLRVFELA